MKGCIVDVPKSRRAQEPMARSFGEAGMIQRLFTDSPCYKRRLSPIYLRGMRSTSRMGRDAQPTSSNSNIHSSDLEDISPTFDPAFRSNIGGGDVQLHSPLSPQIPYGDSHSHDQQQLHLRQQQLTPIPPVPATQYSRKVWWDDLLDTYSSTREQS